MRRHRACGGACGNIDEFALDGGATTYVILAAHCIVSPRRIGLETKTLLFVGREVVTGCECAAILSERHSEFG